MASASHTWHCEMDLARTYLKFGRYEQAHNCAITARRAATELMDSRKVMLADVILATTQTRPILPRLAYVAMCAGFVASLTMLLSCWL